MDFEYFDPKPDDFHGVKALLRTYLDDEVWDVSAFTDLVLAQTTVGTVVKAGEDDSPIGLLTCLNLGRYQVRILGLSLKGGPSEHSPLPLIIIALKRNWFMVKSSSTIGVPQLCIYFECPLMYLPYPVLMLEFEIPLWKVLVEIGTSKAYFHCFKMYSLSVLFVGSNCLAYDLSRLR